MRFKDLPFDWPTLRNLLIFFIGMLVACKLTNSVAYIVTLPIAFWAISTKNSTWLFAMLLYMSTSLCTNGFFIPKTGMMVQMQRGEMCILGLFMLMTIFGQKKALFMTPFFGMFFYLVYMIPVSAQGWAPIVSYMKLLLCFLVFFGFYGMAARVIVDERNNINKIRSVVICYGIYMMVLSVLTWPFPAISQLGAAEMTAADIAAKLEHISLFKGMTQHSQVLGPLAAMVGVITLGDYLFSVRKHFWLYDIILACCLFCLVKSSSRTAMGGLIAGWGILAICFLRARGFKAKWKAAVTQIGAGALVLGVLAVLFVGPVRERVLGFVLKYGGQNAKLSMMTTEDILSSRQGKLDGCIENWKKSPTIGNGFQVSENMKYIRSVKDLLSAPVEKSTWVYAVLEEGGVVGEIIFCLWVLSVIILLGKRHAHIGLAGFVTLITLNMGEFTIFSLSYSGATLWALTFAGSVLDSQRYKLERIVKWSTQAELEELRRLDNTDDFDPYA